MLVSNDGWSANSSIWPQNSIATEFETQGINTYWMRLPINASTEQIGQAIYTQLGMQSRIWQGLLGNEFLKTG